MIELTGGRFRFIVATYTEVLVLKLIHFFMILFLKLRIVSWVVLIVFSKISC